MFLIFIFDLALFFSININKAFTTVIHQYKQETFLYITLGLVPLNKLKSLGITEQNRTKMGSENWHQINIFH